MSKRLRLAKDRRRRGGGRALAATGVGGLTVVASLVSGSAAQAVGRPTVTVNSLGDPAHPSSSIVSHETLADAIEYLDAVAGGGTIQFASGLSGTINLSHALPEVSQPITIDGPGASQLSVDGGGAHGLRYSVLTIATLNGGTTTIDGLTLTDGNAPTYGGAVHATTPVDIVHATLRGNHAGDKGGAIFTQSALEIIGSTITGNRSAHWDGGLAAKPGPGAHVVIDSSTFAENHALTAADGAMYLGSPTLIENTTIAGNTSVEYGAGLGFAAGTPVTVVSSTISGNAVTGKPTSTADQALYAGGGIAQWRGAGTAHTELGIYDSIVAGNRDRVGIGPDVYITNERQYGAPTTLFSLIGDTFGSGISQNRAHNNILGSHKHPVNPRLGRLANHGGPTATMVPKIGSRSFAAGDSSLFAPRALPFSARVDQRGLRRRPGVTRGSGDGTDVGAVELPKNTRAIVAGDREFAMTTLSGRVRVARHARLPIIYTVVRLPRRHHPHLRFRKLELTLSGARRVHVYRHARNQVSLPLRHLRRGRHRLTALVTYASGHGRHTRTGTVRLRFTIRVG